MQTKAKPKQFEMMVWQTIYKTNETKHREDSVGLLNRAQHWELRIDLYKRMVFPCEVETRLRQGMVKFS